jgi:sphingolipid C9-methyltransferase
MEKIRIGISMASKWTDPTMQLIMVVPSGVAVIAATGALIYHGHYLYSSLPILTTSLLYKYVYHGGDEGVKTTDYITFHDKSLEKLYANRRYPMCELYEDYMDGKIAFNSNVEGGDCWKVLQFHRDKFVNYKVTLRQIKWLLSQFIPPWLLKAGFGYGSSSFKDKAATKKEIAEHYDRGNDFFAAFLGPSMVYTCGVFHNLKQTLEEVQFNKMHLICQKLHLKKGERFLDIGCGWGTLTRHAVKEFGAVGTGVTLSEEGKRWCDMKNKEEKVTTEILQMDYRDIPKDRKFHKISSIEMAEHVGLQNFVDPYLSGVHRLLEDDGMFLMQVAGLRQGSNWQDVAWGLFMSKYIFPGADASTPLNWYIRQLEVAGFEVHSVETIGRHYSHTLHKWYDNWLRHKDEIVANPKYGPRLYRLWEFFLAWSVVAAGQGSAACYQILAHKNRYEFPRDIWCDRAAVSGTGLVGVGAAVHLDGKKAE